MGWLGTPSRTPELWRLRAQRRLPQMIGRGDSVRESLSHSDACMTLGLYAQAFTAADIAAEVFAMAP